MAVTTFRASVPQNLKMLTNCRRCATRYLPWHQHWALPLPARSEKSTLRQTMSVKEKAEKFRAWTCVEVFLGARVILCEASDTETFSKPQRCGTLSTWWQEDICPSPTTVWVFMCGRDRGRNRSSALWLFLLCVALQLTPLSYASPHSGRRWILFAWYFLELSSQTWEEELLISSSFSLKCSCDCSKATTAWVLPVFSI